MSRVSLSGNPSGTGTFTIASPNSNTDRTLNLPDQTGTLLTGSGALNINASAPTSSLTLDASGNLGVGTTSPGSTYRVDIQGTAGNSTYAQMNISGASSTKNLIYGDNNGILLLSADVGNVAASSRIQLEVDGSERARIDSSGRLMVGTTTPGGTLTAQQMGTSDAIRVNIGTVGSGFVAVGSSTTMTAAYFATSGGANFAGQITCSGTTTTYATSSDYRLKHDIQPMTGALAKVQQLKPVTYKWNADDSESQGFIAHELQEVVPECVVGEKDAVDADGNPKYQGIDTSFLVATLTAAIQELKAEFDAYKASHP